MQTSGFICNLIEYVILHSHYKTASTGMSIQKNPTNDLHRASTGISIIHKNSKMINCRKRSNASNQLYTVPSSCSFGGECHLTKSSHVDDATPLEGDNLGLGAFDQWGTAFEGKFAAEDSEGRRRRRVTSLEWKVQRRL